MSAVWRDTGGSALLEEEREERVEVDLQIVVPVYNVETMLEACMESILQQQSRFSFQVVVVDDGSTDGSSYVLQRYAGHRKVCLLSQPNGGLSAARNLGMRILTGRYLMFVDSDDCLEVGAVEELMSAAFRTGADMVDGSYLEFDEGGERDRQLHKENEDDFQGNVFGMAWGKVVRSSLFRKLRFPPGYWFEDSLFGYIIPAMCHRVATRRAVVYRYRLNPQGISQTSRLNVKSLDGFYVTRRLLADGYRLGVEYAPRDFLYFLIDIRNNAQRLRGLVGKEVQRAVFEESVRLRKKYFFHFKIEHPDYVGLDEALRTGNFLLYELWTR